MKTELANKLIPILHEMHGIECKTDECNGCDISCELIQGDGDCIYSSLKDIISELLGYGYVIKD